MFCIPICYYVEFYVKFFDVRGPPCSSSTKLCLVYGLVFQYRKSTRRNFEHLQTTLYGFQPLSQSWMVCYISLWKLCLVSFEVCNIEKPGSISRECELIFLGIRFAGTCIIHSGVQRKLESSSVWCIMQFEPKVLSNKPLSFLGINKQLCEISVSG